MIEHDVFQKRLPSMITLTKRLRQESDGKPTKTKKEDSRVSIRDKLLVKEVILM